MMSFAGGSLASGITDAGRHLSVARCAAVVIAPNNMTATDSRSAPFDPACFRIFILFLLRVTCIEARFALPRGHSSLRLSLLER